jgi:hypothetical protein
MQYYVIVSASPTLKQATVNSMRGHCKQESQPTPDKFACAMRPTLLQGFVYVSCVKKHPKIVSIMFSIGLATCAKKYYRLSDLLSGYVPHSNAMAFASLIPDDQKLS